MKENKRQLPIEQEKYLCDLLAHSHDTDLSIRERQSYEKQFQIRLERQEKQGYDMTSFYKIYRWQEGLKLKIRFYNSIDEKK